MEQSQLGQPGISRKALIFSVVVVVLGLILLSAWQFQSKKDTQSNADLKAMIETLNARTANSPSPFFKNLNSATNNKKVDSVSNLTTGLLDRLHKNPTDAGGWLLLARSYDHMGQKRPALDAYAKAAELGQQDTELASRIGYTGNGSIAKATSATDTTSLNLIGELDATDAVKKLITPDAAVFIFARNDKNTPMPLAVAKYSALEWPIRFKLGQQNLMMRASVAVSDQVVISAKISPDGNATNAIAGVKSTELISDKTATGLNLVMQLDSEK